MPKNIKNFTNSESGKVSPQLSIPLADAISNELRGFVMTCGMMALQALLDTERAELCGPAYERGRKSGPRRAGSAPGSLVHVRRPRVRDEHGEVTLPSWAAFSETDPLDERAMEQMVLGVTTRRYARSLEAVPDEIQDYGKSRSAVSRRFKAATEKELAAQQSRTLGELSLVAIMIDGIHIADHVVVTALGIAEDGQKHILGFRDGSTENSEVCSALLRDLVSRGLSVNRSLLFVIDGGLGIREAIRSVFGQRALIQRCRIHKQRNVEGHLPKKLRTRVVQAMREAYALKSAKTAKKRLKALARSLQDSHPSAANSLMEGLDETLTIQSLKLSKRLQRFFSTTNAIENLNGQVRRVTKRVKRWRGGSMILRWIAASYTEAEKGFRRIQGYKGLTILAAALRSHDEKLNQEIDPLLQAA